MCGAWIRGEFRRSVAAGRPSSVGWRMFEFAAEQVLGDTGVAGGSVVGDTEDQRQVQRVRAGGESFVEDAVAADPVDGAPDSLHAQVYEYLADRCGAVHGFRADLDVRVGRVWPGGAAVVEPAADGAVTEATETLAAPGEGDAMVSQVDVGEFQAPDGAGAGRVFGCQGDDDLPGRVGGQLLDRADVIVGQGSRAKSAGRAFRPTVGLVNIRPRFLAKPNSDRRAAVTLARFQPSSGARAALMSVRVTSRRWS